MFKALLRGAAAGAAGTTALNAVTYVDMALRARPASNTPQQSVEVMAEKLGHPVPGQGERHDNRLAGLGPLNGIAAGVGIGAAAGLLRPVLTRLPLPVGATLIAAGAMAAANIPMKKLGVSDPATWSATDWVSDAVPHLAYGLVTHATLRGLSPHPVAAAVTAVSRKAPAAARSRRLAGASGRAAAASRRTAAAASGRTAAAASGRTAAAASEKAAKVSGKAARASGRAAAASAKAITAASRKAATAPIKAAAVTSAAIHHAEQRDVEMRGTSDSYPSDQYRATSRRPSTRTELKPYPRAGKLQRRRKPRGFRRRWRERKAGG